MGISTLNANTEIALLLTLRESCGADQRLLTTDLSRSLGMIGSSHCVALHRVESFTQAARPWLSCSSLSLSLSLKIVVTGSAKTAVSAAFVGSIVRVVKVAANRILADFCVSGDQRPASEAHNVKPGNEEP